MSTTSIFGRIVAGADVETWCIDLAQRWFSTYLAEVERQHNIVAGTIARPRVYVRTTSFDKWPEDQLPALMLVAQGILTPPVKHGDGTYTARWLMGLAAVCSARTQQESHDLASLYMAALRNLFIQRPSLDGHANGVDWVDERNDDLEYDDQRSLSSGRAQFLVQVENVSVADAGPVTPDKPLTPDTDPWPGWPTVQTVDVELINEGGST